ncbi:MAG: isoprenylcysteine carboxylmethyltransferase family protein [Chloroflexi bacterium]|nr:isoprenylcysteine carboxylmethyltransferase family protein [Chloroflexota bacterium]
MSDTPRSFRGRGGAWVVAQMPVGGAALLLALVGPRLPAVLRCPLRWLGLALIGGGGALFVGGARQLGSNLTPYPRPKDDATLVQTGLYRLVRHPIYGGGAIAVLGWALFWGRWAGLLAALGLFVFFDAKARHEEKFLAERYPDYSAYRQRTRRLIPGLY